MNQQAPPARQFRLIRSEVDVEQLKTRLANLQPPLTRNVG
jgi:hypothetical protein